MTFVLCVGAYIPIQAFERHLNMKNIEFHKDHCDCQDMTEEEFDDIKNQLQMNLGTFSRTNLPENLPEKISDQLTTTCQKWLSFLWSFQILDIARYKNHEIDLYSINSKLFVGIIINSFEVSELRGDPESAESKVMNIKRLSKARRAVKKYLQLRFGGKYPVNLHTLFYRD
jgi:hypothetical protein